MTSPVAPPRRSSPAPTRGHERACRRPDDGPPESAYGPGMGIVSPGFSGRGRSLPTCLPGSTSARTSRSFPSARRPRRGRRLRFTITTETGAVHEWDWSAFRALATESPTADLHCVTRWSKLATSREGVSLDTLLAEVETGADYTSVDSCGGYITNLRWRTCSTARRGLPSGTALRKLKCLASRTGAIGQEHVCEASRAKGEPRAREETRR